MDGNDAIHLSVVIVNYNTMQLLDSCLSSLKTHGSTCEMEVIVVDNHSTDGSVQLLEQKYSEVRTILNGENRGFARAANQGYACGRGPYCLILNPDVTILQGSIQTLWAYMES